MKTTTFIQFIVFHCLPSIAVAIECFFQRQSLRDHFCVVYHASFIPPITGFNQSEANSYPDTIITTENMFIGSPYGPNCSVILDKTIEHHAPGLVNYRCTKGVRFDVKSRSLGMKCCSFGETYQTLVHRDAYKSMATEIIAPAQRAMLTNCVVAPTDKALQPYGTSTEQTTAWCPNASRDFCFDLFILPDTANLEDTNSTSTKGCYWHHMAQYVPLEPAVSRSISLLSTKQFCRQMRTADGHQSVLCLCWQGKQCNAHDMAREHYDELLALRRLEAQKRERQRQRRLRLEAERMRNRERTAQKQQLSKERRTLADAAESKQKCAVDDADCTLTSAGAPLLLDVIVLTYVLYLYILHVFMISMFH